VAVYVFAISVSVLKPWKKVGEIYIRVFKAVLTAKHKHKKGG